MNCFEKVLWSFLSFWTPTLLINNDVFADLLFKFLLSKGFHTIYQYCLSFYCLPFSLLFKDHPCFHNIYHCCFYYVLFNLHAKRTHWALFTICHTWIMSKIFFSKCSKSFTLFLSNTRLDISRKKKWCWELVLNYFNTHQRITYYFNAG